MQTTIRVYFTKLIHVQISSDSLQQRKNHKHYKYHIYMTKSNWDQKATHTEIIIIFIVT